MFEDHAKLVSLLNLAGEVVGRKKLQKIVYILKKLDYPFQEKYQFHFYGPYSEELTLRIEELCNLGFISEVKESKGGYHQYRYSLTGKGGDFLSHYQIDMPKLQEFIADLNGQNSKFLELVSTILYFENLSKEEIINKVKVVKKKQNYSDEDIQQAFVFIEQLQSKQSAS
ncbi:YwgA family protein [Scopulibacillus cellulosilyticus]|uniref:YwgA family protein n=1 Tax=Scopulibacillus cellulosilyticus TaxID=2665665 RepID=A0ABW2PX07_9BACL